MVGIKVLTCRGCGSSKLESIDSLGEFPYANEFPLNKHGDWQRHRLALVVCHECTLCQLDEYPDLVTLYSNYIWMTNSSNFVHKYLDGLAERLVLLNAGKFEKVVEVASNDATFLKKLKGHAHNLIGIEPAKNLIQYYENTEIELISDLFSSDCVETNQKLLSGTSLIIARNVLAHVPDIHSFLLACKSCLNLHGFLYLEFHDGDEIINKLQFDSIYHEHQSYITERALDLILHKAGFRIHSSWLGPIGGSSRSIVATIEDERTSIDISEYTSNSVTKLFLHEIQNWKYFRKNLDVYKIELEKMLMDMRIKKLNIVGYGASARSTTLAGFCDLSRWLTAIVDSSPVKRGRFWTGSDLIVKSPSEVEWSEVDVIVLLAWNFQQEIINQLTNLGFGGIVLRVLPFKPELIEVKNAH